MVRVDDLLPDVGVVDVTADLLGVTTALGLPGLTLIRSEDRDCTGACGCAALGVAAFVVAVV